MMPARGARRAARRLAQLCYASCGWMKTSFKTLEQFFPAVNALIERLIAERHDGEARRLHSLIHETTWTTGSELLGEFMLAFKDMKGKYSPEVAKEIKECLEFTIHHRRILGLK